MRSGGRGPRAAKPGPRELLPELDAEDPLARLDRAKHDLRTEVQLETDSLLGRSLSVRAAAPGDEDLPVPLRHRDEELGRAGPHPPVLVVPHQPELLVPAAGEPKNRIEDSLPENRLRQPIPLSPHKSFLFSRIFSGLEWHKTPSCVQIIYNILAKMGRGCLLASARYTPHNPQALFVS